MRLSTRGRELIKGFEGVSLTAYPDAKGYSIGYGHFGASKGQVISKAEADRLFDLDVQRFELAVSKATPRAEPHEFDAMCSLAYNVGADAFTRSTVARRHNAGDTTGAADAFLMWNQSGGAVLQVLVNRRERERDVYLHGYGTAAPSSPSSGGGGGGLKAGALIAMAAGALLLWRFR